MRSMTGFGSASAERDGVGYTVEIRSLNNRYLKANMRLPEDLQALEAELETILRRKLNRGTITIRVARSAGPGANALTVDTTTLGSYLGQLRNLPGLDGPDLHIDLATLMNLPGVLRPAVDEVEQFERARGVVCQLTDEACEGVLDMRRREGEALVDELHHQLRVIQSHLARVAELAPGVVECYQNRLKQRIESLLRDAELRLDQVELVREIAVYAEKTDIAEEVQRLGAHLDQFLTLIDKRDSAPIGRTLDFLSQELLREANTIASKSPDSEISKLVVEVKGAIDRIKEQVQNVE